MTDASIEDLVIEQASLDDLPVVAELLLRAVPHCVPQTVAQLWSLPSTIWVARSPEGQIFASASLAPLPGRRRELRSVVVDPDLRGRGVGRALVAHLLRWQEKAGREVCCVTRNPEFFENLGFEPLGTPWESGTASCRTRRRIPMHWTPSSVGLEVLR